MPHLNLCESTISLPSVSRDQSNVKTPSDEDVLLPSNLNSHTSHDLPRPGPSVSIALSEVEEASTSENLGACAPCPSRLRAIPSTGRALSPVVEEIDLDDSVFASSDQVAPRGAHLTDSAPRYNLRQLSTRKRGPSPPPSPELPPVKREKSLADVFEKLKSSADGGVGDFGVTDFHQTLMSSQFVSNLSETVSVPIPNRDISTIIITSGDEESSSPNEDEEEDEDED